MAQNPYNNAQWGDQYSDPSQPRIQLEQEFEYSLPQQSHSGPSFQPNFQFGNGSSLQNSFAQSQARSSSYPRPSHSPSGSVDRSHFIGVSTPQQHLSSFSFDNQASGFLNPESHPQYHNNISSYNLQMSATPTPVTATSLGAGGSGDVRPHHQSSAPYSQAPPSLRQQPKTKRHRTVDIVRDEKDNEDLEGEEDSNARAKPLGACARCKTLKVKCELKTDTDPCKRCFNGGYECVTPGRKKRRTPPKREHLLNQIREQAAEIQQLMAQLEKTNNAPVKPPNTAATDTFPLSPSSSGIHSPVLSPTSNGSYFDAGVIGPACPDNVETNKVVEDWIAKARGSLAEFDGFIGIGGAGLSKRYLVEEDLEDSSSGDDDHAVSDDDDLGDGTTHGGAVDIEVMDSDGEEVPVGHRGHRGVKDRQMSNSSSTTDRNPKKKDSGNTKLATLPSEASPFGLMADLSLKTGLAESPEAVDAPALGVANADFFRSSPTPDPMRGRQLNPAMPHILTRGVITPQEAEKLFDIYFQCMNISVSLLDPVLYTPQKTCFRSPFLFTVVCAIASRFYTERPELYNQAMHFAQLAAGTALIGGHPKMAIDLNLHLPNTAKPINESHEREMLNRTRVWLNCFNLDRSTGSQYGKAPTISNSDYMANHSEDWWRKSTYNIPNFDIHICAYNSELKVMAGFMSKIYSDPEHPTGLNKVGESLSSEVALTAVQNVDFEKVAAETDEELKRLGEKWQSVLNETDVCDPQNCFRTGLLKLAYGYARLVALSFGFQHAFGKNHSDENPFLNRCLAAATDVVIALVDDVGRPEQRIYLRHGPIAQSVFATFAASILVKLLQPKFSSYLTAEKRQEMRGLVKKVIDLLGSPDVSIDDKHGPHLYARFLKGLLAAPLVKDSRPRRSVRNSLGLGDSMELASNHTSPEASDTLSPAPTTAALSFDRFAPPLGGSIDPFMPLVQEHHSALGLEADMSPPDFFPASAPYNPSGNGTYDPSWQGTSFASALQSILVLTRLWTDFSWLNQGWTNGMYTNQTFHQ
ncbi:unnamed protein product [Mycena citricolor]|uniref:Zn(2)-C6 fungal-type domain-containing protein n=1 Tax=Mycena citricolor TaxID=2018698 RepID=A0AAD2H3J9_9AGAR|nr:unnamed protein product [Mycena citricolor]